MWCFQGGAGAGGETTYSSVHVEFPPSSVIAQVYLTAHVDITDPHIAKVYFKSCEFIDDFGVHRTDNTVSSSPIVIKNKLVRMDFETQVKEGSFNWIMNIFFWPNVF